MLSQHTLVPPYANSYWICSSFNLKFRKIAADFSWLHIYYPKTFNTRRIDDFGTKDKSYISVQSVLALLTGLWNYFCFRCSEGSMLTKVDFQHGMSWKHTTFTNHHFNCSTFHCRGNAKAFISNFWYTCIYNCSSKVASSKVSILLNTKIVSIP
jgi:hypothetical protein